MSARMTSPKKITSSSFPVSTSFTKTVSNLGSKLAAPAPPGKTFPHLGTLVLDEINQSD